MKIMKLKEFYKILAFTFISINAFSQSYVYNGNIVGISGTHIVNQISTTYNSETISGEYLTILGRGNSTITNPFIIVEGIDFLNDQDFDTHLDLYNDGNDSYTNLNNSLIYSLYNNGYDVLILDFDDATDYIQHNAMLLVSLINSFNLSDDNLIVMGYSMGGLVSRYALSWMESQCQNHHTRLYISHDSPHKGANFPLGLQELIEDIRNNTSVAWIAVDILIKSFEYSMPAARQMLVYHYENSKDGLARPSDDKIDLFTEMYNLNPEGNGYPSIPVKIAISNGNYSGNNQTGLSVGDEILHFDYNKDNDGLQLCECNLWQWIWGNCNDCSSFAPDEIKATVRTGFDASSPLEEFSIYSLGKNEIGNTGVKLIMGGSGSQTFSSNNYSYDIAPGSYSPGFMMLLGNTIWTQLTTNVSYITNTCFIPTISALDLNKGLSDPFDINNSQCSTVFDYIYANQSSNSNHFDLASGAKDFIINHVLTNENPINRLIYDDTDIEIANKTIFANEQYDKSASNSIFNSGSFLIKTGGYSNLVAGNSITLKPGFTAENGSVFSASINSTNFACSSSIIYSPHYLAPQPRSASSSEYASIIYNCSNIESFPSYNDELLYFDCYESFEHTTTQMDSLLNENISIYPNPTTGLLTITFSSEIILA